MNICPCLVGLCIRMCQLTDYIQSTANWRQECSYIHTSERVCLHVFVFLFPVLIICQLIRLHSYLFPSLSICFTLSLSSSLVPLTCLPFLSLSLVSCGGLFLGRLVHFSRKSSSVPGKVEHIERNQKANGGIKKTLVFFQPFSKTPH